MNKIKIFKTNNKDIIKKEMEINDWAEEENFEILQINVVQGAVYTSANLPKSYSTEVEFFIVVLYK